MKHGQVIGESRGAPGQGCYHTRRKRPEMLSDAYASRNIERLRRWRVILGTPPRQIDTMRISRELPPRWAREGKNVRFYTGLGDDGTTDLLGARVEKDDPRVEALGSLDETSSAIGLARAMAMTDRVRDDLVAVQRDLYRIMAELAFTPDLRPAAYDFGADRVDWLGLETEHLAAGVDLPREFILPGESAPGAALDVARAVTRRGEREVVALMHAGEQVNPAILGYLNRLSSLLFIAARVEDQAAGSAVKRAKVR